MSEYSLFEFMRQIEKAVNAGKLNMKDRHLLWHYIVHQHKTFDYVFDDETVSEFLGKGMCPDNVRDARKHLADQGIIKTEIAFERKGCTGAGRKGTYIKVCYEWTFENITTENITTENITTKNITTKNITTENIAADISPTILMSKEINESQESHESLEQGEDQREEKKEREETGGQAAVPASESATEGSHSTGEPDLLGKIAPLPEKQEKPKKAKPFIPPTRDEVRSELESLLTEKGTIQQWSDRDLRAMTDKFFKWYEDGNWEKNNGKKLKDWQRSLNRTWLSKQHYLPERTTRNQQQLAGQKKTGSSYLDDLTTDATAVL